MTERDREIQELRRTIQQVQRDYNRIQKDYDRISKSETVQYYLRKNAAGEYVNDIMALDRGIRDLHKRCQKAEKEAQLSKSEAVFYRRKYEALENVRREEEEDRFPLFHSDARSDENQHAEA